MEDLEYRKFPKLEQYESKLSSFICESEKRLKKLGEGGQSSIYVLNEDLIIRTIDLNFGNCKQETLANLILTEAVKTNINPHFTITHKLYNCGNLVFQVLERFDGDIVKVSDSRLKSTGFYIQMLMGILTLLFNDIRLDDVKKENILFRKLSAETEICYLVDGSFYVVKTDTLYSFTDYGKATNYSPDSSRDIKNLSDLNSIVKIHKGEDVRNTSDDFFKEFEDLNGVCDNPNVTTAKSIFYLYGKSRTKLISCVRSRIKKLATKGKSSGIVFRPETKIEYIDANSVC